MPKKKYTLHELVLESQPDADVVIGIKAAAIEVFKTKVVWDKRTRHLVENMPLHAYVLNAENQTFELDLEYVKEAALLASLDMGNGRRLYFGVL